MQDALKKVAMIFKHGPNILLTQKEKRSAPYARLVEVK